MVTKGLVVRLEARPGKDAEIEEFLGSALPLVRQEGGTTAWFGVRFGRGEYGIVDVFPDEAARQAHLEGAVAAALMSRADELFAAPPDIAHCDVLAHKLPAHKAAPVTKAVLLELQAKAGSEAELASFLRAAQPLVEEEEGTLAWFAIQLAPDRCAIFDVFPDNGARFAHLTGQVPRELAKKALALLGGFPDLQLLDVTASVLTPARDPAAA